MQSMDEQDNEAIRDALIHDRDFDFLGTLDADFKRLSHAFGKAGKALSEVAKEISRESKI